jgi:hypothetical protein
VNGKRRALRRAAAVLFAALCLVLGAAAAVGTASSGTTETGPMPCDPDTCQPPPPTTTTTTPTTTTSPTGTTSTTPTGGSTQCTDGFDNDGDRLVDGNDPACSGPDDNDESDDPPLDSYVGTSDSQFARLDEGAVGTDSFGGTIRCAWLGAERSEHGFVTKGWSFYMRVHWCWNGRTVVSWTGWDKWVSNHIPFPISLLYPLDWRLVSESPPSVGVFQTSAFAQAKVSICPVKAPICFNWLPWLRFTFDAQGHALCQSDVRNSIPDCKG